MNDLYREAKVINRMRNSTIIENKSNLAFLQNRFECSKLPSYVAVNAKAVQSWCEKHWSSEANTDSGELDWWVVKASSANGGRDVFIMNKSNQSDIIQSLTAWEEYVIQK